MRKIILSAALLISSLGLSAQKNTINTLKDRITVSGYMHLGYDYKHSDGESDNTFKISKAVLTAKGKITNKVSCLFMYSFANKAKVLEAYADYSMKPWMKFRGGQFKMPFTLENEMSPCDLEMVYSQSQAVKYLAGRGNGLYQKSSSGRDIGAMVYGDIFYGYGTYYLAVMNGAGINTKDNNNAKNVIANLKLYPYEWLTVGGSFIHGKGNRTYKANDNIISENYKVRRYAVGALAKSKYVDLRSEFIAGKDGDVSSYGWYATTSVHIAKKFDILASYDYLDKDKSVDNNVSIMETIGAQYWFYPQCRLQVAFAHNKVKNGNDNNQLLAQLQIKF